MKRTHSFLLLLALLVVPTWGCDGDSDDCENDPCQIAEDTSQDGTGTDGTQQPGPCGADELCNNSDECGGGSPMDYSSSIDPDCADCWCNYYAGVCEAVSNGASMACPCDYDCLGLDTACNQDGHCDTWCPDCTDPDCTGCGSCDLYGHICEAGSKCSSNTCDHDMDCEGGVFSACTADGFCDSWCPVDVDPDCFFDPKNGQYCDDTSCALNGECDPSCPTGDPDCPGCACADVAGVCEVAQETLGDPVPCPCDVDCVMGKLPCKDDGACDEDCPKDEAGCVDDPDCPCMPECDRHGGICDAAAGCSSEPCPGDEDCETKSPCRTDTVCDSWCPVNGDPDCVADPLNGYYCDDTTCASNGTCDPDCQTGDPDCPGCACAIDQGVCGADPTAPESPCPCDFDCLVGLLPCAADSVCDPSCPVADGVPQDPDCEPQAP